MSDDAVLAIAISLAAGVIVQSIAIHLNVPGIALLLVAGYLLGPDGAGLVNPHAIGPALHTIVAFAVAVILFEGGLNLSVARLRREQLAIRRIITIGAPLTAVCATVLAMTLLRWPVRTAILFGTLVVVTGPTVVTPLLRRIRIKRHLSTILEAEGVIADALGALVAVVALELAIDVNLSARSLALGIGGLFTRFGAGIAFGAAGGAFVAFLLRFENLVPERLQNVTVLGLVIAIVEVSNYVVSQSGIVAAIVAGMLVGYFRRGVRRELRDFKEQVTLLLIGMLFILLAASVRRRELVDLGKPALVTVLALMLVVRPLAIAVSTMGTGLALREKAFLAWLAPRGIIAAAVASLFAETLAANGLPGGDELRAMVFLVIAATVLLQGFPAGLVARLLGVRRPDDAGYAIVGANGLGRLLGRALREGGQEVVLIDADPDVCRLAEEDGFRVVYGNALEERTLSRAGLDSGVGVIAVTKNEAINVLCLRRVRSEYQVQRGYAAIDSRRIALNAPGANALGTRVLFGAPRDLKYWIGRADRDEVVLERWIVGGRSAGQAEGPGDGLDAEGLRPLLLPLAVHRGRRVLVVDDRFTPRPRDEVWLGAAADHLAQVHEVLEARGWKQQPGPVPAPAQEDATAAASIS